MKQKIKENKKTARIGGARCTPEDKKLLEDISRNEGCGGEIWPLIWKKLLNKKKPKKLTPRQVELDEMLGKVEEIYHWIIEADCPIEWKIEMCESLKPLAKALDKEITNGNS